MEAAGKVEGTELAKDTRTIDKARKGTDTDKIVQRK